MLFLQPFSPWLTSFPTVLHVVSKWFSYISSLSDLSVIQSTAIFFNVHVCSTLSTVFVYKNLTLKTLIAERMDESGDRMALEEDDLIPRVQSADSRQMRSADRCHYVVAEQSHHHLARGLPLQNPILQKQIVR